MNNYRYIYFFLFCGILTPANTTYAQTVTIPDIVRLITLTPAAIVTEINHVNSLHLNDRFYRNGPNENYRIYTEEVRSVISLNNRHSNNALQDSISFIERKNEELIYKSGLLQQVTTASSFIGNQSFQMTIVSYHVNGMSLVITEKSTDAAGHNDQTFVRYHYNLKDSLLRRKETINSNVRKEETIYSYTKNKPVKLLSSHTTYFDDGNASSYNCGTDYVYSNNSYYTSTILSYCNKYISGKWNRVITDTVRETAEKKSEGIKISTLRQTGVAAIIEVRSYTIENNRITDIFNADTDKKKIQTTFYSRDNRSFADVSSSGRPDAQDRKYLFEYKIGKNDAITISLLHPVTETNITGVTYILKTFSFKRKNVKL